MKKYETKNKENLKILFEEQIKDLQSKIKSDKFYIKYYRENIESLESKISNLTNLNKEINLINSLNKDEKIEENKKTNLELLKFLSTKKKEEEKNLDRPKRRLSYFEKQLSIHETQLSTFENFFNKKFKNKTIT